MTLEKKFGEYNETFLKVQRLNLKLDNLKQDIVKLSINDWEVEINNQFKLKIFNNSLRGIGYLWQFDINTYYIKLGQVLYAIEQLKNDKPMLDENSVLIYSDDDIYSEHYIMIKPNKTLDIMCYVLYNKGHSKTNEFYISKDNLLNILENILKMTV